MNFWFPILCSIPNQQNKETYQKIEDIDQIKNNSKKSGIEINPKGKQLLSCLSKELEIKDLGIFGNWSGLVKQYDSYISVKMRIGLKETNDCVQTTYRMEPNNKLWSILEGDPVEGKY